MWVDGSKPSPSLFVSRFHRERERESDCEEQGGSRSKTKSNPLESITTEKHDSWDSKYRSDHFMQEMQRPGKVPRKFDPVTANWASKRLDFKS